MYPLIDLNAIRDFLLAKRQSIAIAESVTGGHLQAAFSSTDNARSFFQGGITAYNLGQKCRHLGVEPIHALECDCVSEDVAIKMALGVSRLFCCSNAVGITGYAAKVPEKNINSLFAYYAITYNNTILLSGKLDAPEEDAVQVQLYYTTEVIKQVRKAFGI